jgi:hypothetical protein
MCCRNLKRNERFRKTILFSIFSLLFKFSTFSQDGVTGINKATELVQSYFAPGTTLLYMIGGISGLVGAVKVYQKWSSGEQDAMRTAASWFGACIFLVVVAAVLQSFFNI